MKRLFAKMRNNGDFCECKTAEVQDIIIDTIKQQMTGDTVLKVASWHAKGEELYFHCLVLAYERWLKANDRLHLLSNQEQFDHFHRYAEPLRDKALELICDFLMVKEAILEKDDMH